MNRISPMLAASLPSVENLLLPALVSPKIDGIRCLVTPGVTTRMQAYTRALKAIPNQYVRETLETVLPLGHFDGELTVGPQNALDCISVTSSAIMSASGQPDFCYNIFDAPVAGTARERTAYVATELTKWATGLKGETLELFNKHVRLVPHHALRSYEEIKQYYVWATASGYEGMITRHAGAGYVTKRASSSLQHLVKFKAEATDEAVVVGVKQLIKNENPSIRNARGYLEKSSSAGGKVPQESLGALVCRVLKTGVEFNLGGGFTADQRLELWAKRDSLMGKIVTFKSVPHGVKEAPRFPVFVSFRDRIDL